MLQMLNDDNLFLFVFTSFLYSFLFAKYSILSSCFRDFFNCPVVLTAELDVCQRALHVFTRITRLCCEVDNSSTPVVFSHHRYDLEHVSFSIF